MFSVPKTHTVLHNDLLNYNTEIANIVRREFFSRDPHLEGTTHPITVLSHLLHQQNRRVGWWTDPKTGKDITRNFAEVLMLKVSEVAEGYEGLLGDLMDDKLPERKMLEVELADVAIRIYDTLGGFGLCIDSGIVDGFDWQIEVRTWGRMAQGGPEMQLMHIILPLSQSMEAARKAKRYDDRAPGLLQALLRCYVIGHTRNLDIAGAVADKAVFNIDRADHQLANRKLAGGKAF